MRAYDPKKAAQHHDEIHAHVPSEPALRVKALESCWELCVNLGDDG